MTYGAEILHAKRPPTIVNSVVMCEMYECMSVTQRDSYDQLNTLWNLVFALTKFPFLSKQLDFMGKICQAMVNVTKPSHIYVVQRQMVD